ENLLLRSVTVSAGGGTAWRLFDKIVRGENALKAVFVINHGEASNTSLGHFIEGGSNVICCTAADGIMVGDVPDQDLTSHSIAGAQSDADITVSDYGNDLTVGIEHGKETDV